MHETIRSILRFYAVLGFALLLFRRASSRTLLWSSVALACVGWPLPWSGLFRAALGGQGRHHRQGASLTSEVAAEG